MGLKKTLKKVGKKILKTAAKSLPGPLGAIAGAGVNALLGSKGSKKAASQSAGGYEASAEQQRAALGQVTGYQQPYMDIGNQGGNALMRLNSGDYSGFENSPDFLYARDRGISDIDNSAAARGGLFSGNTGRRLAEFSSDLATRNLGNFRNALMGQIGVGQNAAGTLTNATLGTAAGIGSNLIGAGDARASGTVGATNAVTGAVDDVAGALGDYYGNKLLRKKPPVGAATTPTNKMTNRVPLAMAPY